MSKAFTKENDTDQEEQDATATPDLLSGRKNYMTPAGAQKLRDEFELLMHTTRPEVVKVVAWAAGNGDRSENADYYYGKRRLREIDRRLRYLTRRLDALEVIDPASQSFAEVRFGATVELVDEQAKNSTYRIVGIDEIDLSLGHISWVSPIGKALLGARAGDVISLRTPGGLREFEIISVKYLTF